MKKQNQFVQALKCCLTNGKFALLLISNIFLFASCNKDLSREEANRQLKIMYGEPFVVYTYIDLDIMDYLHLVRWEPNSNKLMQYYNLVNSNLLEIKNLDFREQMLLTDEGLKYSDQKAKYMTTNGKFITNTLVFKSIDRILMSSKSTATVDIKLERNGITPFGEFIGYKKGDLVSKQIQFNKYDNGWQMNTSENRIYASNFSFFKNGEYVPSISQNISTEGLDDEQETEAEIVKNEQEVKETKDDLNKQIQQINLPTEINK